MPTSNFQPIRLLDPGFLYKFAYLMANSADPDQLASSEANCSGSALFAKAGNILASAGPGLILHIENKKYINGHPGKTAVTKHSLPEATKKKR